MPEPAALSPATLAGSVLLADDDRALRQVLARRLAAAGHAVTLAADGEEAWEKLRRDPPEVAILDWTMPGVEGVELCRRIKDDPGTRAVYCIVLTARDRTEDKVRALDCGADDYLLKPCEEEELLARIRAGLRIHRLHRKLEEVSLTDPLTGLGNRRHFDERLFEEVSRARRHRTALSLVILDLDRFKETNDRHGHPTGDRVLAAAAEAIRARARVGEFAARIGGDEFAVILPNTPVDGARALARDLEAILARTEVVAESGARVAASATAGAAQLEPGMDGPGLFAAADAAFYARKRERARPT